MGNQITAFPVSLRSSTNLTFNNSITSNTAPDTNRYSQRDKIDFSNSLETFTGFKPSNSINRLTQVDRNIVADSLSIKTNKVIGWS